tara:strand:+ start:74 stop:547 length:474 start_codon:yes stop_codon:yes gene_type:complete
MNKFKVGDRVLLGYSGEIVTLLSQKVLIKGNDKEAWEYEGGWDNADCMSLESPLQVVPPHGGPSAYYDFPFSEWVTSNDQMEYFATNKWLQYSLHLKDVFKACCRWGDKEGTSLEYDARKIVYSGLRLLMMIKGKEVVQEYLKELVEDGQFKENEDV